MQRNRLSISFGFRTQLSILCWQSIIQSVTEVLKLKKMLLIDFITVVGFKICFRQREDFLEYKYCMYHEEKTTRFSSTYKYALLSKREVKMAGYWPSSFLRFYGNAIKEQDQYSAILTEQAWSIKDLLYRFTFKLKLQQQNKTEHKTVLLGKEFFTAGWCKIYFQRIFG